MCVVRRFLEHQQLRSLSESLHHTTLSHHLSRAQDSYIYSTSLENALFWSFKYWQHHSAKLEFCRRVCWLHPTGTLAHSFSEETLGGHSVNELYYFGMGVSLALFLKSQPASPPRRDCFGLSSQVPVAPALLSSAPCGGGSAAHRWNLWSTSPLEVFVLDSG